MSLGRLVIELALDSQSFDVSLVRANGQIHKFTQNAGLADKHIQKAERSTRSWGRALRDTVITLALVRSAIQNVSDAALGWQHAIIGVNAEIQRSTQLMKAFSKQLDPTVAAQEAMLDVRTLLDKAANSPFDLNAITDAFVKIRVAGVEPAHKALNNLVDAVANFGGSSDNLKRAGVAIQQMAGKGVISLEELRQQLGESVPTAIQNMADGLGVSYSKLVKQISLGRVRAEPALIAMMREMELQFKGSAARMMQTWDGAVARFQTQAKEMALAFGGMDQNYGENTYMGALVGELNSLTDLMKDPAILQSARDMGAALAEMVRTAADGVRWIVHYRAEIYELAKALATLLVAYKGMKLAQGIMNGLIGGVAGTVTAIGSLRQGIGPLLTQMNGLDRGLQKNIKNLQQKKGALGAVGTGVAGVAGVLGMVTGPLGLVAAALASGAYAWWEYDKSVKGAMRSLLESKGLMAGMAELVKMQDQVAKNEKRIAELKANPDGNLAERMLVDAEGRRLLVKNEIAQLEQENARYGEAIANAMSNVTSSAVRTGIQAASRAANAQLQIAQKEQTAKLIEWRKKVEAADGQATPELMAEKVAIETEAMRREYEIQKNVIAQLQQDIDRGFTVRDGKQILFSESELVAKRGAVQDLSQELAKLELQHAELAASAKQFGDTIMNDAGADMKFNPLVQYFTNLSIAVARAGAKAEEENPHLAQLNQIIENMQGMDQKVDPGLVARVEKLAATRWEQEKALKALKDATTTYSDSLERLSQIEKLAGAKLNKVENENPWLNASADAQRYREELIQLNEALAVAREAAVKLNNTELAGKIDAAAARFVEAANLLDSVSVTDASKKMRADADAIERALMTETERSRTQYEQQLAYAQDYYARYEAEINANAEAHANYYRYLDALREQYERENESGLQAWIRENEDATQQYKQMWASAMNSFVGTVTDGLIEGKMQFKDFVEEILKEIMRIVMAKTIAGIAGNIMGSFPTVGGTAAPSPSVPASQFGQLGGRYESPLSNFANGGIMTKWGSAKLKEYANGGIAKSPQVAVFGEGDMAEAYVPLPDGRSIPVTLQGNLSGGSPQPAQAPVVQVNVINQSSQDVNADEGESRFDGEQYVVDVVLKNITKPGPLREAIRSNS